MEESSFNSWMQMHPVRALLVSLFLLSALTAGCFGGGNEPGNGETPPRNGGGTGGNDGGGTVTPPPKEPVTQFRLLTQFVFEGCTGVRFEGLQPADEVQALLPEGYTALKEQNSQNLPVPQAHSAYYGADLFNCTSFTAGIYDFENVVYGMAYIPVEQPDDGPEADVHLYVVQTIGAEDVLAAIWLAAGYVSHNGTYAYTDTPAARSIAAGDYTLETSALVPGAQAAVTERFAFYHEQENGDRLLWTGERSFSTGPGGAGDLSFPADAPFAPFAAVPRQPQPGEGFAIDAASFTGMDMVRELAQYRGADGAA